MVADNPEGVLKERLWFDTLQNGGLQDSSGGFPRNLLFPGRPMHSVLEEGQDELRNELTVILGPVKAVMRRPVHTVLVGVGLAVQSA